MNKQLPIVNTFNPPLEIWSQRNMTEEEMQIFYQENAYFRYTINDKLLAKIDTSYKAAEYIAQVGADNRVENFIDTALSTSINYKLMKQMMPYKTPNELFNYQKKYPFYDDYQLNNDIHAINAILSKQQVLFHGGKWINDMQTKLVTIKPFSTTFSPLVALNEALHKGKAFDANGIDLFVVKVNNPQTPVFVYKNKGTLFGHEKEVLFASGAKLKLISKKLINQNFRVTKIFNGIQEKEKHVPLRILEVEIQ